MDSSVKTSRVAVVFTVLLALVILYISTLYKLQVIDDTEKLESSVDLTAVTTTQYAARGSILDRNGKLLVSDKTVYNIKISRSQLLKQDDPNNIVLSLCKAATSYGISYTDTFPVTASGPFQYLVNMSDTQSSRLKSYFDYFGLSEDISASDFISWLRDHYKIDYTVTAEDARIIIGIRYELEIRVIVNTTEYTFAKDVTTDFITYISESHYPSVSIETSSEREFHTTYAAHILGYTGKITSSEYEKYKDLGYPLNCYVGKSGVEYAFEEYLHGTEGSVTTYTDSAGAVVNKEINSEAKAGDNVYLTIDIDLQEVAENSLKSAIESINLERDEDEEKAEAGAVVVLDVNTSDCLVMASYPTFDPSGLLNNYSELSNDPTAPLYNRATNGTYNPGSTFKMVTALAALKSGTISPQTTITDKGIYEEYADLGYRPKCWIYPGNHGTLNVVGALENSCNYFFYSVADKLGITAIAETAREFGFGEKTGIEIGEKIGSVASREYKREALNEGWWSADTLISCIGQGLNYFTPIQIANYVSTIANGGTLHEATLLKYIAGADYSDIVYEEAPTVRNVIDDSDGYIGVLQKGMRAVAKTGTASSVFANYPIPVSAKTGTVQSDSAAMNTGVFVCYAPSDDPEIAIAVVVEKGGSGSALTGIAKDILDEYFSDVSIIESVGTDNSLLK